MVQQVQDVSTHRRAIAPSSPSVLVAAESLSEHHPRETTLPIGRGLSREVLHHLASASDRVSTVGLMVRPDGQQAVPAMALHTMVRAAVEATATAAWLLLPVVRDERVLRSQRLTYDNRRQLRTILSERGLKDPEFETMATRLEAIRDARPRLRGGELGKKTLATNTTRLEETGVLVGPEVPTPLEVWRMTSGIAHGNSSIALNVPETTLAQKVEGATTSTPQRPISGCSPCS